MTLATAATPQGPVALRIDRVSKSFPGGKALDSVSFDIRPGRVHALVGANGSGKSTLVKLLAGVQPADAGGRLVVGEKQVDVSHMSPATSKEFGFRFVHQHPGTFPEMTVAENIALGNTMPGRLGTISQAQMRQDAAQLLDFFHIDATPRTLIRQLRPAAQAMVAIARALRDHANAQELLTLLVLDEPTASLPDDEAQLVLETAARVAESGIAVVFISHRLEELLQIGHDLTVLRDGQHVVTRSAEGVTEGQLVEYIVGRPLTRSDSSASRVPARDGAVVLDVRNLSAGPVRDASFQVHRGEILGIAGLLGSGRSELLHAIFGDLARTSGSVHVAGQALPTGSVAKAMRSGLSLVPEDRPGQAMFADQSIRSNLSIGNTARYSHYGLMRPSQERRDAKGAITAFGIKSRSERQLMSTLSGGNQQKVILARALQRQPKVLLLDEPTQGVDVGARGDAYAIIRKAAADGVATIVVSSDFEELAEIANRVLILRDGRIVGEVSGPGIDRHQLTELTLVKEGDAA